MSIARTERIATAPPDGPVEVLPRNIPHAQYHGPEYLHNRMPRPRVHGKFLFVADEKFWSRGVTYGTFKPNATGAEFSDQKIVEQDFDAIADAGLNSIRVYTPPPLCFWTLPPVAACA